VSQGRRLSQSQMMMKLLSLRSFLPRGFKCRLTPVFTEILLKYRVQLYQLTPNAIAQLSKYFWAVMSFGGEPSSDGFSKCYELHYQSKKVVVDGFERFQQFSVINFHAKRGGEVELTPAIKNKWSTGWMKAWFYCKVPLQAATDQLSVTSYIISRRRLLLMALGDFISSVLSIFMRSGASSGYQEQVVDRMDEGLVLLEGVLAYLPTRRGGGSG
jgi:hypothetical protein